jgi:hypothetical protein
MYNAELVALRRRKQLAMAPRDDVHTGALQAENCLLLARSSHHRARISLYHVEEASRERFGVSQIRMLNRASSS